MAWLRMLACRVRSRQDVPPRSQCSFSEHSNQLGWGWCGWRAASSSKLCLRGLSDASLNRHQIENFERSLRKVFPSKIETA